MLSNKVIVVFPGQGSQVVGMGHDIYKNHHVARQVFDEIDDTLNFKLSKIIFEGPEHLLTFTPNTQPALMAVSLALVRVVEYEIKKKIFDFAEVILGHSLGEYSALCSLNAISLSDAATLLRLRGEAMQNSVEGIQTKMVAVIGLDLEQIENVIKNVNFSNDDICEIANDNCPGQVILSGTKNGVEMISELLKKNGARTVIDLKVSAPFHCKLMKNASLIIEEQLNVTKFNKLESKFISNVTADFETDTSIIKNLLIKQVCSRVKWRESIEKSIENIRSIVEIGSGKILTGMNRRIDKSLNLDNISNHKDLESYLNKNKEIL